MLSPLTGGYRGLELAFMPGATGGITALEILNVLAEFPSAQVTYRTPGGLHLRAEAVRLAFSTASAIWATPSRHRPLGGPRLRAYAHDLARQIKPAGRTTAGPLTLEIRPEWECPRWGRRGPPGLSR